MASPVDTSVKFYNERMPGAPVLTGVVGSLTTLLDAVLVNGFGTQNVTSIVVSGGIATVTLPSNAANPELADAVQLFAGASNANINGEQKILTATATQVTFATAEADGTIGGTITMKTPGLGLSIAYTTTNKRSYRITDAMSTVKPYLDVDDTISGGWTEVRMYETMTAIATGTNKSPTNIQSTNSGWMKSLSPGATAIPWDIFGDSRFFYYMPNGGYSSSTTYVSQGAYVFGEIKPFRSADTWQCVLGYFSTYTSTMHGNIFNGGMSSGGGLRVLRGYSGVGLSQFSNVYCVSGGTNQFSGVDPYWGLFPSLDGKLRGSRINVIEVATVGNDSCILRGEIPGAFYIPTKGSASTFGRTSKVVIDSKKCKTVLVAASFNADINGTGWAAIDITGPWR